MSCNHRQSLATALQIVEAAKNAGADAVKIQAYGKDTLTLDCDREYFHITSGPWARKRLYDLYAEASLPWEYISPLKERATELGLILFPSVFSVDDITRPELADMPLWKVASFEITDIGLIRALSDTGKPIIISTGMATEDEIVEAVRAVETRYFHDFALLQCTSGYPAPMSELNLQTLKRLQFHAPVVGLSDHTLSVNVPVAAVALGARVIEKHLCLRRADGGPDSGFSLEPEEFRDMVKAVRDTEAAMGGVSFGPTESEKAQLPFRRSLFVVKDIATGGELTRDNVRSIRPAMGLHPRHLDEVLGKTAKTDIARGTPLSWDLIC